MPHLSRPSALLSVLALVAGCSSTQALEPRTLPYHVAIVPMEAPLVGAVSPGELPGGETELRVDLTPDEVTAAMAGALQEYCFARVTVLEPPQAEAADALQARRAALERARSAGADLVVELGLRYDGEIYREEAGTFWLNWPLFLFAGPSAWFIGDNGYYADVELTATLYDLNALYGGGFELGDAAAQVLLTSARYGGADLKFTDRADGAGDYALGILAPSGYLSRQSDSTEAEVEQRILEDLRYQVVQGIQSRRGDLVGAEWIAPMFVDPDAVLLTREGDLLLVSGRVSLLRDGLVQRVDALELAAGGPVVRVQPEPDPSLGTERHVVLPFEVRVPLAAGARELRVECRAGARDRYVRSYTFALPPAPTEG